MPTLRILADGRPVYATPGGPDPRGVPAFVVGGGETVQVTLDYTAWLAGAALDVSSWAVEGGQIVSDSAVGATASALVTTPTVLADPQALQGPGPVTLDHVCRAADGRVKRTLVRLYTVPASINSDVILDVSTLG